MSDTTPVQVTQADRETAAACARYFGHEFTGCEILAGEADMCSLVLIVAAHRLAAIEEAAKVADAAAAAKDGEPQFGGYARAEKNEAERIAAAIRKLGETV